MSDSLKTSAAVAAVVLLVAGSASALGPGFGTSNGVAADHGAQYEQTAQSAVNDADVDATLNNGTVTLTLTDETDRDGVANASVEVNREYQQQYNEQNRTQAALKHNYEGEYSGTRSHEDEYEGDYQHKHEYEYEGEYEHGEYGEYNRVGMTDANGTVSFALTPDESQNVTEVEVELVKGVFNAEVKYGVENDSLSIVSEEYQYEQEAENEEGYEEPHQQGENNTTRDESAHTSVSLSDARTTADDALTTPSQGHWELVEGDAHEGDSYYKFEYTLVNADYPGEAEIRVDGTTGDVTRYEQDIERQEASEEREEQSEQEEQEGGQEEREEQEEEQDEPEGEEREEQEEEQDELEEREESEEEDQGQDE